MLKKLKFKIFKTKDVIVDVFEDWKLLIFLSVIMAIFMLIANFLGHQVLEKLEKAERVKSENTVTQTIP